MYILSREKKNKNGEKNIHFNKLNYVPTVDIVDRYTWPSWLLHTLLLCTNKNKFSQATPLVL